MEPMNSLRSSVAASSTKLPEIVRRYESELLADWVKAQLSATTLRPDLLKESELRQHSGELLRLLANATKDGDFQNLDRAAWLPVKEFLASISASRAKQGFNPSETATFVFSLKEPLFARLQQAHGQDAEALINDVWLASVLLDHLGLYTTEQYQKARESVIARQQEEMLELSTPVVKLWDGILALPLIGTLDSARTQVVMESLLQKIVETGCNVAIIDITGVPTVDTLVAQHLIRTITAARLMGADCIISGIRPQIAQTIVHLGVALSDVTTKASLADAFSLALDRLNMGVCRRAAPKE